MRVVHCSVVVILAALCAFASAAVYPAASDRVKNLWEPLTDAVNPSNDVLTFHMYWYLNDAKATEARCHERGPGGTAAVLQCKTEALGPTSNQVAATKAWLSALAPQCDFAWNAVHCRGVRVGDVAKLFTLPTTAFRSWVKKFGNAKRWILTERAVRIPSACAIESISGLHHMDYVTRTAKHMGQRKPPAPKTVASAAPIPPSPYGPVAPEMLINFGDFTSQGPLVVGADGFAVTFIPKCQKGSYLLYSNTVAFSKTCVTKGDIAPVSAFATFTAVDGASKTITTPKYSLSEIYNTTASYLLSLDYSTAAGSGSSSAGHIDPSFSQVFTSPVFFLPPPSKGLQGISTWGRVSVSVTVGYPDGSSVTDSLTAFYNAVDFYGNSLDPAGNIIAQRPQILITNPNPNYLQPTDFRTAYSVPNGATATQQVSGVVEFSDASEPSRGLQTKDIEWYLGNLSESGSGRFKIIGNSTIVSRGETTLDIELMMGLATGGTAYIYCLTYGTTKIVQYPDALEAFASSAFAQGSDASTFTEGISTVWSISYGGPEWLTETGAPDAQLLRVNTLLKHLTDAGITVTASSGDDGSYFLAGGAVLSPNFPASSPYVVGVGATAINPDGSLRTSNAKDGNIITSGGGYSQAFGVPSWQNKSLPGTNVTRGVPDISAAGAWIYTILDGSVQPLFGTSASSPLIASLIVLLNRAVQMHDPSKGSLRQATNFLYQQPSTTYTDVKVGDNCAGEHSQSPLSNNFAVYSWGSVKSVACFQATPGWDATTGLGAPSLSALLTPAYSWTPGSLPPDTPAPVTNPTTPVPSHGPQTPSPKEDSSSDHLLIGVCVAAGLAVVGVGFCVYRRYSNRRPAGEVWGVQSGGQQNAQAIYASMPSNYKPTNYNTAATTDYV